MKIYGGGNRSLILLPFAVLFATYVYSEISKRTKRPFLLRAFLIIIVIIQILTSFSWLFIKASNVPQQLASRWIINNVGDNESIGLENIPIYQLVPDIIQKEFYYDQYRVVTKNKYKYEIIDENSTKLPKIVIVTNDNIEQQLLSNSPKNNLLKRLKQEGFKKIKVFKPDFTYYSLIGNEQDFYLANILTLPVTISIYEK